MVVPQPRVQQMQFVALMADIDIASNRGALLILVLATWLIPLLTECSGFSCSGSSRGFLVLFATGRGAVCCCYGALLPLVDDVPPVRFEISSSTSSGWILLLLPNRDGERLNVEEISSPWRKVAHQPTYTSRLFFFFSAIFHQILCFICSPPPFLLSAPLLISFLYPIVLTGVPCTNLRLSWHSNRLLSILPTK